MDSESSGSSVVADVAHELQLDTATVQAVVSEFMLHLHRHALTYSGINGDLIGEELHQQLDQQAFYHLVGFLDWFSDRYGWEPGSSVEYLRRLRPEHEWLPYRRQLDDLRGR